MLHNAFLFIGQNDCDQNLCVVFFFFSCMVLEWITADFFVNKYRTVIYSLLLGEEFKSGSTFLQTSYFVNQYFYIIQT